MLLAPCTAVGAGSGLSQIPSQARPALGRALGWCLLEQVVKQFPLGGWETGLWLMPW